MSNTRKLKNGTEMVFDAKAKAAEIAASSKPFPFFDLEGVLHELPSTQLLTGLQIARLMGGDAAVIKEINDEAYEAILAMPTGVGEALAEAWIEFSGDLGKEPTPSQPTQSDGSPSSPISPSEDSTSTN